MQDPKDVKNKRGVSVSGNTNALWVPGLIPGSITQALIDPGKLIRLIHHREDGRKQNEFPDYKKVKAEGNRHGEGPESEAGSSSRFPDRTRTAHPQSSQIQP